MKCKNFKEKYCTTVTKLVEDVKEISPAVIRLNLPYVCTHTKPGQRTTDQETQCYVPPEPLVVRTLPKDIQGADEGAYDHLHPVAADVVRAIRKDRQRADRLLVFGCP